jgi:RNA recognition motif-containing protein
MKLYVGNMSFDTSEAEVRKAFEAHGQVDSVTIIMDRDTGRPKGFGFVEMPNDAEAKKAIEGLNGKDFMGRTLNVNEARPRTDGPRGGGPRGGGSGGGRRSY